jgi:hypothetical protein
MMSPTDSLLGTSLVRRTAYAVGLIALFGIAFGFTWSRAIIVTAMILVGESAELASPFPGLDERHLRLALGLVVVAAGGVAQSAGRHDCRRGRSRRRLASARRTL